MVQLPIRCLLGVCLLAAATPGLADTLTARVVGISDGDTITVLDAANTQQKIRLAAIDAPEKGQPFGNRSKENLSRLVYGKEARVDWEEIKGLRLTDDLAGIRTVELLRLPMSVAAKADAEHGEGRDVCQGCPHQVVTLPAWPRERPERGPSRRSASKSPFGRFGSHSGRSGAACPALPPAMCGSSAAEREFCDGLAPQRFAPTLTPRPLQTPPSA